MFSVTGVDPNLKMLGLPTSVKNVTGAKKALAAVEELKASGKEQIKVVQIDVGELSIPELKRQASEEPDA